MLSCAGNSRQALNAGRVPEDLAISVSIPPSTPGLPAGWLILEPDGALRAATGTRTPASAAPQVVRTLTRGEIIELWTLATALSLPGEREGDAVVVVARGRMYSGDMTGAEALAGRMSEMAWMK